MIKFNKRFYDLGYEDAQRGLKPRTVFPMNRRDTIDSYQSGYYDGKAVVNYDRAVALQDVE